MFCIIHCILKSNKIHSMLSLSQLTCSLKHMLINRDVLELTQLLADTADNQNIL